MEYAYTKHFFARVQDQQMLLTYQRIRLLSLLLGVFLGHVVGVTGCSDTSSDAADTTVAPGDSTVSDTADIVESLDTPQADDIVVTDVNTTDIGSVQDIADTDITTDGGSTTLPRIPCTNERQTFNSTVVGEWTVQWSPQTGSLTVIPPHGGPPVWSLTGTCLGHPSPVRIASGVPFAETSFGAFRIFLESGPEPGQTGMSWYNVDGVPRITANGSVTVEWIADNGQPVRIVITSHDRSDLRVELEADPVDSPDEIPTNGGELSFDCSPGEGFFGLGTQSTGMDLRGGTYPLWTQEQGIGKPETGVFFPLNNVPEAAYAPMGVWHTSRGASMVLVHNRYSELDLCAKDPARGALRSAFALPGFVLVAGSSPKQRLGRLTEYVGRVSSVAPWVFGPWNDSVGGPEKLWEVAKKLRDNGIPSSVIWSEDWIGGEQTTTGYRLSYAWAWDPKTYPDLPEDVVKLHDMGFGFLAYFNPFVPKDVSMFAEGTKNGGLIHTAEGAVYEFLDPAFRDASMVDLTNPAARTWLKSYLTTAAQQLGIDGWMADFAEWLPHDALMHSGESGWLAHNRYPLDWQKLNREVMEEVHKDGGDWTFFVRSGWADIHGGTSGLAPVMWGGDQNTDWKPDDGIPSVTPIAAHVGMAGVAIFGSDIAGYTSVVNPNTDKELFFRWAAMGAFHPVMRTHHGSDECENWTFDRDPETMAHYRRYARIHTLLFPYFQRLLFEAQTLGLPMVRHPYLVFPEKPFLWAEAQGQFFLGDDLLVAPVVTQGATTRGVIFPSAGYWPLLGQTPVESDAAEVAAPLSEIPVFVRPGTALMLLCDVVDSFYGATDPDVTDLSDVAQCAKVGLYPDESGNCVETTGSGVTITTTGLVNTPDWETAIVNGQAVSPCGEESPKTTCFTADGLTVMANQAEIQVGTAVIIIDTTEVVQITLAYAGAVFGDDVTPTEVGELYPDIVPPCLKE